MVSEEQHYLENENYQRYSSPQQTLLPKKRFVRYNSVLRRRGPLNDDRLLEKRVSKPNKEKSGSPDSLEALQWAQKFISRGRSLLKTVSNEDKQFQRELEQNKIRTKAHEKCISGLLQDVVETEDIDAVGNGDRFADSQHYGTDTSFKNYDETMNASLAFTDLATPNNYTGEPFEVRDNNQVFGESHEGESEEDDEEDDDGEGEEEEENYQTYRSGSHSNQASDSDDDDVIEILSTEESADERPLSSATQLHEDRDQSSSEIQDDSASDSNQSETSEEDEKGLFHSDSGSEVQEHHGPSLQHAEKAVLAANVYSATGNIAPFDSYDEPRSELLNHIDPGLKCEESSFNSGEDHDEAGVVLDVEDYVEEESGAFDSCNLPHLNTHGIAPAFNLVEKENEASSAISQEEEESWGSQENLDSDASERTAAEFGDRESHDFQEMVEQNSSEGEVDLDPENGDKDACVQGSNEFIDRDAPISSEAAVNYDYTNIARDAFNQRDAVDTIASNFASPAILDSDTANAHVSDESNEPLETQESETHRLSHASDNEVHNQEYEYNNEGSDAESGNLLIEEVDEEMERQTSEEDRADDENCDSVKDDGFQSSTSEPPQDEVEILESDSVKEMSPRNFAVDKEVGMQSSTFLAPVESSFHFENNADQTITTTVGDTTYFSCGEDAGHQSILRGMQLDENKAASDASNAKYKLVYSESLYSESENDDSDDKVKSDLTDYVSAFASDPFSVTNLDAQLRIVKEMIGGLEEASQKKVTSDRAESTRTLSACGSEAHSSPHLVSNPHVTPEDVDLDKAKTDIKENTHGDSDVLKVGAATVQSLGTESQFSSDVDENIERSLNTHPISHNSEEQTTHGDVNFRGVDALETPDVPPAAKEAVNSNNEGFTKSSEQLAVFELNENDHPLQDRQEDSGIQGSILVEEIVDEREIYATIHTEPDVSIAGSEREPSVFALSNVLETSSLGDADFDPLDNFEDQGVGESPKMDDSGGSENSLSAGDLEGSFDTAKSEHMHVVESDLSAFEELREKPDSNENDSKTLSESVPLDSGEIEPSGRGEQFGVENENDERDTECTPVFGTLEPQDSDSRSTVSTSFYEVTTGGDVGSLKRTHDNEVEENPLKKRNFLKSTLESTSDRISRAKAIITDVPGKVKLLKFIPQQSSKLVRNAVVIGTVLAHRPITFTNSLKAAVGDVTERAERRITTSLRNELRALKAKTYNERLLQSLEHLDSASDESESEDETSAEEEEELLTPNFSDQTDTSIATGEFTDSTFRGFDDSFEGSADESNMPHVYQETTLRVNQPEITDRNIISLKEENASTGSTGIKQDEDAFSSQHENAVSGFDNSSAGFDDFSINPSTLEIDNSISLINTPGESYYSSTESSDDDSDFSTSTGLPRNALSRRKVRKRVSKRGRKTRV
ncbi:Esc1p LALA0_S01e05182g [Lachancea lanzarotensis]|uniref:LALA0S01e05182g1_1 n=1 Tax=Lachancea lanzarotensis TaxID=1245769 RepID=A0A0C7N3Y8_9SACH|nr:uncharacterized protein LALA0_S01e05182g [Lachancea lanzarotensis]CEP60196.1 LALA0S01e05182g1_1 [Lachancea lanzarotensis]